MSDLKLFRVADGSVTELTGQSIAVEKSLQTLIESHLDTFLGVQFLDSEYTTGKTHGGRIDTLGIDENGYPVIIEYKRALNENVINQGLFYLDWLLDHQSEFYLLTLKKLGKTAADGIEWSKPRLLCVAGDFTKYDQYAVQQIRRDIELIRYRRYGDDLVLLELITGGGELSVTDDPISPANNSKTIYKTVSEFLEQADPSLQDLFESVRAFLMAFGDDVQMNVLKNYFAFKRLKNFACVEVHAKTKKLLIFVKSVPESIEFEQGFTRDARLRACQTHDGKELRGKLTTASNKRRSDRY